MAKMKNLPHSIFGNKHFKEFLSFFGNNDTKSWKPEKCAIRTIAIGKIIKNFFIENFEYNVQLIQLPRISEKISQDDVNEKIIKGYFRNLIINILTFFLLNMTAGRITVEEIQLQ